MSSNLPGILPGLMTGGVAAAAVSTAAACESQDGGEQRDLWLYRDRTVALLKRYLRLSIEVGRLPSVLGREIFRSRVTSYRMSTFEDAVIFVHDVERALERLDLFSRQLIAAIIFEEYTQEETAEVLRCGRRTVSRGFPAAVDEISNIFLTGGLLNRLPLMPVENGCQEGKAGPSRLSACQQPE
ncbi:MAG TPA: hypothetical protein VFB00_09325 [Terriglobales bacterium]|nr:hypothetical protein [Terriglobales bacterium]